MKNSHYGKYRLADMDSTPADEYYERPIEATIRDDDILAISDEIEIYQQTWVLQHKVVWFVISQLHRVSKTSEPVEIARIDCCVGMVHEHRFNYDGEDVLDHRLNQALPLDATPDFVDTAYARSVESSY